jgi:hypothetical protein
MRRDMQIISNIVTVSKSSLLLFALSRLRELSAAYAYEWLTQYLNQHRSQKRIAYTKYIKVFLATKNSGKITGLWNQRSTKSVSQNSYRLITHPRVCGLRKWISKPNSENTIATGNAEYAMYSLETCKKKVTVQWEGTHHAILRVGYRTSKTAVNGSLIQVQKW